MDFSHFEKWRQTDTKAACCSNKELVRTDDWYECRHCHTIEPLFVEAVDASSQSYYINLAYTPVTHFKSRLAQLQGKENKLIPRDILDLCKDCKTISEIQNVLQEHQQPKFYKHKMKIANTLGITIPELSKAEEDQVLSIFRTKFPMTQNKNHIPYQFMLYQLMILIHREDIQPYLDITKDKKKLSKYLHIWDRSTSDSVKAS